MSDMPNIIPVTEISFAGARQFARYAQESYEDCHEEMATREATISIAISLALIAQLLERISQGLTVYDGNL